MCKLLSGMWVHSSLSNWRLWIKIWSIFTWRHTKQAMYVHSIYWIVHRGQDAVKYPLHQPYTGTLLKAGRRNVCSAANETQEFEFYLQFCHEVKGKRSWHIPASQRERHLPSMCLFAQLLSFSPLIKHHQSLGTAGPATGRMINSLCQAPSQMVLTLSWRAWTLSIKHHLFKMLDVKPWQGLYKWMHPTFLHGGSHPGMECMKTPHLSKAWHTHSEFLPHLMRTYAERGQKSQQNQNQALQKIIICTDN